MAKTALVAIACLSSSASFALDLVASYYSALNADPSIRAADHAVIAGREKTVQGRALLLPQASLSASYAYVDGGSVSQLPQIPSEWTGPEGSGAVRQLSVRVAQPLYNAKATAESEQMRQLSELSEIDFRGARQDLMLRVSEAYFGVLLAQDALRVVQAEKVAVRMQRERAQARFDVGRGKITELQEAQARYDTVLTREVSAQSTLSLRRAQYEELTGAPADGLAELRPDFVPMPPQPDLPEWLRMAGDGNLRVLARQHELAIATVEIDKYKLSGRPSLELVASYTIRGGHQSLSQSGGADANRSAVVGVQLSMPLYSGGSISSRERESIAKRDQAQEQLNSARRDARLQVQDTFLSVKTGVARIEALEQSVRSAQTALEATTLGRDVGTRTELDVLDAQQRLFSAQIDLAQARNEYLLGRVRLASAAGGLREDDLRALNGYLVK